MGTSTEALKRMLDESRKCDSETRIETLEMVVVQQSEWIELLQERLVAVCNSMVDALKA